MKQAVICFTRVPRPGQTKTRLLPILSPEQCAALHWAFLKDLNEVYRQVEADLFVAYTPDPAWEQLKQVFPDARFLVQKGKDLGQRMYRSIRTVLELGYEAVVLTGSDLPMMGIDHLDRGFAGLEAADVVLGPTSDGGYYLIGMKEPRKAVFQIDGYGGDSVYHNTIAAAQQAGLTVANALLCDDVDTPEDLRQLARIVSPNSHTGRYLQILKQEGIAL